MSRADREVPLERRDPRSSPSRAAANFALFGALAALIVGLAWQWTREPIAANRARHTLAELTQVLPAELYDNEPHRDVIWRDTGSGTPVPVWRARRGGAPSAAVLTTVAPDGYVGDIRLLVAVDADGRIIGVRVAEHRETPGIGDEIEPRRSDWLLGFPGRSAEDPPAGGWRFRKDGGEFDAITGATITSRAVVAAIGRAVQYFASNRDEIFAAPVERPPDPRANDESTRTTRAMEQP